MSSLKRSISLMSPPSLFLLFGDLIRLKSPTTSQSLSFNVSVSKRIPSAGIQSSNRADGMPPAEAGTANEGGGAEGGGARSYHRGERDPHLGSWEYICREPNR
ncbi:hypothetical protein GQ55_8G126100 [Panicum hallii var. hallii]|uniref:Uncharacterized protein n=1 Tax=Panicum hallii var. hallii TaxID=1504633 RepID=A0A2T7CMX4_9POAL|nr:hypothetical protein GQ55_8G126100 [Panicum hallii var. hallii]